MIESKLTKVKVNNEIELCEVYDGAVKDRIRKVFFREGISFFIKFRKKLGMDGLASVNLADAQEKRTRFVERKEGRYVICVNKSQQEAATRAIMRIVPNYEEKLRFFEEEAQSQSVKGRAAFLEGGIIAETAVF